ncbi:hypothetical protein WN55_06729 [Dufourea novaeangliae]|uniref:Uncharacterized protein n=1 Tax=Dufourea novaeangliae TaxID=178035 RepID=A0A154PT44_DUFNO|nr:hypothetical protein WN55_06729 [Dufourea novaeangliae]
MLPNEDAVIVRIFQRTLTLILRQTQVQLHRRDVDIEIDTTRRRLHKLKIIVT